MIKKINVLGFFTHPGTADEYLNLIRQSIEQQNRITVFYHHQHTVYQYLTTESLRAYFENKLVIVDGMGVIFLYKLLGIPLTRDHRITYVDFIVPLMQQCQKRDWRVFHVGQSSKTLETALDKLRQQIPGLQIDGHHGYFEQNSTADNQQVIQRINDFSADILLVGLGTPYQEAWAHVHRSQLNVTVVLTCGACMEYVAGAVRTPPRWMGQIGLEWLFRVLENPLRFGYRYTFQTCQLLWLLTRNWWTQRISVKPDK